MRLTPNFKETAYPFLVFAAIIALWQLSVTVFRVPPTVLPSPLSVMTALIGNFKSAILPEMLFTLGVIVSGYAISVVVGFVMAAVCSQSRFLTRAVSPIAVMFLMTPMIIMIPILMVFFGFTTRIRVAVVVLQASPIILLNSLTGFTRAANQGRELLAAHGCSRLTGFFKFTVFRAMPEIFAGLKLGCIISVIAAIGADFTMGKVGLGYRIKMSSSVAAIDLVFATILVTALIGICMFSLIALLERKVVVWRQQ